VPKPREGQTKFYVADGPLATSVSEVSEAYFQECLNSGRGGVRVVLGDGATEFMSGSRYLAPGTQLRVEEVEDQLQIIYLGVALRQYSNWLDYSDDVQPGDHSVWS
jgi:hypothetical protein